MKRYVIGVAFGSKGKIVTIRKNRPRWQDGKLNFPGGKIEPGEIPEFAIHREWKEEVGQHIARADWEKFAVIREEGVFEVWCLRTDVVAEPSEHCLDGAEYGNEHVVMVTQTQLRKELANGTAIENLPWILALAMDRERRNGIAVIPYHDPIEGAPNATD